MSDKVTGGPEWQDVPGYEGFYQVSSEGELPKDPLRFARPHWFKGDAECDWHEDEGHENGSYYCKCLECDADFIGHKRRHICRKCHYEAKARYDALSPEERKAFDEKRDAEIKAFFEKKGNNDHG